MGLRKMQDAIFAFFEIGSECAREVLRVPAEEVLVKCEGCFIGAHGHTYHFASEIPDLVSNYKD